jgi:hypothetical protein
MFGTCVLFAVTDDTAPSHGVRLLESANARPLSLICRLVEKPPGHSPGHPPHRPADRLPSCSPDSPAGCSRSRLPESPDSRLPNRSPGCPDGSSLNRSPDSLEESRSGNSPRRPPHHPPHNPPDCFPGHAWSHLRAAETCAALRRLGVLALAGSAACGRQRPAGVTPSDRSAARAVRSSFTLPADCPAGRWPARPLPPSMRSLPSRVPRPALDAGWR